MRKNLVLGAEMSAACRYIGTQRGRCRCYVFESKAAFERSGECKLSCMDEENLKKYLDQLEALRAELQAIDFFDQQYEAKPKQGELEAAAFAARQQLRLAIIKELHRLSVQVWILTTPLSAVDDRNSSPSNDAREKRGEI